MARLGGNPDLSKYQFTTERHEPLSSKFTLRVTPSMLTQLRSLDGNWREFVREAISDKLKQSKEYLPKSSK